jgi:hypothetical protein
MRHLVTVAAVLALMADKPARAQENATPQDQPQPTAPSDRAVNLAQPDFTLIGLPTTLKIPRFASSFRVTHRFTRSVGAGDFGDLVEDAFGLDFAAQIGLEYRFGIMSGTQIGIHRTSDKTIEFFGQYHLLEQEGGSPVGIDVIATIEGTDNFDHNHSPAIGAVISRTMGRWGALYLHPIWINNTNALPSELVDDNDTTILGIGGRLRIRPTVYIVAEGAPRFGYDPDYTYVSFGIEKRAGGHMFQLNFSTGFGTTLAQIARGGADHDTWYLGFNISRKFF